MSSTLLEQIKQRIQRLSADEKAELLEWLNARSETQSNSEKPNRSMLGLLADLGPAPSDEDIEEVRREMWKNFPRDDF